MKLPSLHSTYVGLRPALVAQILVVLGAGVALQMLGCGDSGSGLVDPYFRQGSIQIEITRGTVPEFTWDGDVTVQSISVHERDAAGNISRTLWGYAAIDQAPPVEYGEQLDGENLAVGGTPPELRRGQRYRVTVTRSGEESHADWIVP